ncbi:Protein hipA [Pseudohaliea rubra DSM 19751]|uniref:Protein hipA n=2 Tax=Pseudohaliea TaxID=1341120 RepID=A0A095VQR7_9GAMM|nr:Protein hipA [Pseudohaliea rubra DSM 19751]
MDPTMIELPTRIDRVDIDCFGSPAGTLTQPAHYEFAYRQDAAFPCSLTMPLRAEAYRHGAMHPVFAQNLPEGFIRRYISQRLERYATVNDMYLLALQQDSAIGHIRANSSLAPRSYDQVSLEDILRWQGPEPIFGELLERFYLRGMLSGVQPKTLVPIATRSTIPQEDLIVKTFDPEFDLLTVNEFVCMSAAAACNLGPPTFWLSDDLRSFVIERFDRKDGEQLAFEDFTVLTGREKYRGSYETLLRAVGDYTQQPSEVARAYRLTVFNCLIGNGDAHLKNYAVLYNKSMTVPLLAPPYDITHTLIYPTIDNRMALKIDGARGFPDRRALVKLGHDAGIKRPEAIVDELADLLGAFLAACPQLALIPGFRQSLTASLDHGARRERKGFRRDKNRKYPTP